MSSLRLKKNINAFGIMNLVAILVGASSLRVNTQSAHRPGASFRRTSSYRSPLFSLWNSDDVRSTNSCYGRSLLAASATLGADTYETSSTVKTAKSETKNRRFLILRHGQTDANAGDLIQGSSDFSRLTALGREQAAAVAREGFILTHDYDDQKHKKAKETATSYAKTNSRTIPPASTKIDSVLVSPLTRARETLAILRSNADANNLVLPSDDMVLDNLREIDLYDWEGVDKQTLQNKYGASYKAWKAGDPNNFVVFDSPHFELPRFQTILRRPLFELWDRAEEIWEEIHDRLEDEAGTTSSTTLLVCHGSLGQALLGSAMGWDATSFRKHKFPNCGLVEIEFPSFSENHSNRNRNYFGAASRWRWRWPRTLDWNYNEEI